MIENPKYSMMTELIGIFYGANTKYQGLYQVLDTLQTYAYGENETQKSIFARRILTSYNDLIRDLDSETLVLPQYKEDHEMSAQILFGVLLGITNERLDVTNI